MDGLFKRRTRRGWLFLLAVLVGACIAPAPAATMAPPTPGEAVVAQPSTTATSLSAPETTPTPECVPSDVLVEEATYAAVAIRAEVPVLFLLPDCVADAQGVLPVLFLLHGKPMTEQQWLDLDLPVLLREGWEARRWPPMVLVAARQPEPLFSNTDGGRGSYEQEFLEGLVPFVESIQPVGGKDARRAMLGISRGGVWALEIALTHPSVIGTVAALSPALAVNYARPAFNPLALATTMTGVPRFYLGAGVDDWAQAHTERLARSLEASQADFRLDIVVGGHDEGTWKALIPYALDFIASGWGEGWGEPGDGPGGDGPEIR